MGDANAMTVSDATASPAANAAGKQLPELVIRPEFEAVEIGPADISDVARRLSLGERLWNINGIRKAVILLGLVAFWQIYTVAMDVEPLMMPRFSLAASALIDSLLNGPLIGQIWFSVKVLLMGYAAGLAIAAILVLWATASRTGSDFIAMSTAMFNPLPAIALLPLAMLWFGLGTASLVFVLIHSVLWAVALNTHSGFRNVSQTLRMIGQTYGLRGVPYVAKILVPAAFPSILAGMKVGWAFAWRTLIGAELVFGSSSGSGGLGWYIFAASQDIETEKVFAGLFMVILIGIVVENVVFRNIELKTVNRWGMQR
jgi:NitT/TauT family transport system permease protein